MTCYNSGTASKFRVVRGAEGKRLRYADLIDGRERGGAGHRDLDGREFFTLS